MSVSRVVSRLPVKCLATRLTPRNATAVVTAKRNFWWRDDPFSRQIRSMERDFNRLWRDTAGLMDSFGHWPRPLLGGGRFVEPLDSPLFDGRGFVSPIVEKEGKKFVQLTFDVHKFSPENVKVSTKDNTLTIKAKAKHETDDTASKYEFERTITLPEGVHVKELACRYTENGVLILEAPYEPPKVVEKPKPKAQYIDVKHE